jgi:hypothetical protein
MQLVGVVLLILISIILLSYIATWAFGFFGGLTNSLYEFTSNSCKGELKLVGYKLDKNFIVIVKNVGDYVEGKVWSIFVFRENELKDYKEITLPFEKLTQYESTTLILDLNVSQGDKIKILTPEGCRLTFYVD